MRQSLLALAFMLFLAALAQAGIQTETVTYQAGDTQLVGYVAYDDAVTGRRPAVLVVHEWWGLNDYAKSRARMLAELGYVGFAVDMYGQGRTTTDPQQAGAWAGEVRGQADLARARMVAAIRAVRRLAQVDGDKLAVIGYCFGGTIALETARGGAPVKAVVSFHGNLETKNPARSGDIKAKVLVCNGAEDTFVSAQSLKDFEAEMRAAGADWQLIQYGGAVHSFTNPDADKFKIPGVGYHKLADQRSWMAMRVFLNEAFSS